MIITSRELVAMGERMEKNNPVLISETRERVTIKIVAAANVGHEQYNTSIAARRSWRKRYFSNIYILQLLGL